MLAYRPRTGAGWSTCAAARRSGRRGVRALRQLHRAARRRRGSFHERDCGARAAARPGVTVEPRRMWPTGMKALGVGRGREDPADLTAEPGRALGRLTDIGWAASSGPCWPRARRTNRSASRWCRRDHGASRLGLGAAAGRRARPAVTHQAAADHQPGPPARQGGRLPYLGALAYAGQDGLDGPGPRRHNSAQRLSSCGTPWRYPVTCGRRRRPGRPGARGGRPHRDRLDDDRGGPAAPPGGRAAVLPLVLAVTAG